MRYKGIICQKKLLWQFYSIYRTAPKQRPLKSQNTLVNQDIHLRQECLSEGHALLDLSDGESRVEALGAGPAAVEDSVATVQAHAVVEAVHALGSPLVTGVGDPAV